MKQPELFRGTNWEFNLLLKGSGKLPQKAIHGPLVSKLTRPLQCQPLQEAWYNLSIRWRMRWRGAKRLQVHPVASIHFFGFKSRRAFHVPPLYFIIPLSDSQPFIPSHCLPPHTKYIYYPAVCCRWAPLAGFPLLGRMQETRRREEGKDRNQSKHFCSPASSRCKTNGGKTEHSSNQYTSLLIKQTW